MSKYIKLEGAINAIEDKIAEYIPTLYGRYAEIPLELRMAIESLPNWQIPYCQMAIWLSQQGYVVFTSSHKEVREMLKDCGEYCIAIVPTKELKKQWIERLYDRYEKSGLEKDRNAYLNAVDRYEANLAEIEEDIADTFLIDSMDYDLQRIVSKCEQIEKIVKGAEE